MLEPEVFLPFIQRLEALGAPYMLTGSVAGILYGEPRMTHDVDVVLALPAALAARVEELFQLDEFYCPPADVIAIEARRGQRGHFNLIHHATGFKADIYVAHDALHAYGLGARRRMSLGNVDTWVAPPEYVILRKLEYFREGQSPKHMTDIASMLAVSGAEIDRELIERKAGELGLLELWRRCVES